MRRLVAIFLAWLLGLGLSVPLHAAERLRVGVEGAYPPFSSVGPDGQLRGFDIDIAKALCAQMKAECTLIQQSFDGMIPALNARKFDLLVASHAITAERQRVVDFSEKYYQTPARLIGKAGLVLAATEAGLKGKRIGVQRATTHDRFATDTFKQSEIVRYTRQDDVFLDLGAGRVDVALLDSVAASAGFLKTPAGQGFALIGPAFNDSRYFGAGSGVVVRKGNAQLLQRVNAALQAIRANGTYQHIQSKYFDFDVYGSPGP